MTANPLQIYIDICSGLLYMPLLIGCLKLPEANKRVIMLITIFIVISPILLSHQTSLVDTPFSDWRLGASLAGFYVVFSHLLTSILQLKKKVLQLTESNIKLGQTAITDSLTQLLNRRGFEDLRQQTQYENSGIIMLDIDHFKSINDRFGHDIGDVVLATVASKLKQVTRTEDLVCRWGGEEFLLVVVLNKNEPDANTFLFQLATKILKSIKTVDWSPIHPELKTVTASAGTMLISDESDFQQALIAADHALLNAKRAGRNRVNVGSITVESQNT
jgi:diguanylate cyclase (GGDEF)-like protein